GFDEALRLNEKEEVSSACMANVFWVEDEVVFTPSLETGCLEGTTRAFVIEICKDLGIEIYTVKETLNKLLLADEVFLTSSGIGIVPVRKIESEFFTSELTTTLRREFYKRVL
ncbi:MAG: aminotransferase class IV, partial [Pyrinomonadaceae bacterium]